jgi:hypothetical protein
MKGIVSTIALLSASTGCSSGYAKGAEQCDPQAVAKAETGYSCVVQTKNGPVSWRIEAVLTGSRRFRVVRDLKSGLYISDDMGKHPYESTVNQNLCQSPAYSNEEGNLASVTWRLPSGYPHALNGKNGFPNRDSDFVVLDDDGIRAVVPELVNKWFLSSSATGMAMAGHYGYDGEFGGLDGGCEGNGNVSLRCVGQ